MQPLNRDLVAAPHVAEQSLQVDQTEQMSLHVSGQFGLRQLIYPFLSQLLVTGHVRNRDR